jgi:hypothetical protein
VDWNSRRDLRTEKRGRLQKIVELVKLGAAPEENRATRG